MTKVTEAFQNFLLARKKDHNGPDLIDQWSPNFETQLLVSKSKGELVEGLPSTYTDGKFTWHNIRVPKKANSEPEWFDYELGFPIDFFGVGIGTTWWDWGNRSSYRLGYDFDAITGHAVGVGISDDQLKQIRDLALEIDWIEARKSKSGNGLHLYAILDGIPTENHTLHTALGRCVLGMASQACGFDFSQAVDACGGNMWIWHVEATHENEGFKLIKPATDKLSESDLPVNWRDHVEVVAKRRSRVRVRGIPEIELGDFEKLVSAKNNVKLNAEHRKHLQAIEEAGASCSWVHDHGLAQTHTWALKEVHKKLGLKGFFETNSEGRDLGTPNCFMFPKSDGAWHVCRFSKGMSEHGTWQQDGIGYTSTAFNEVPSLRKACHACGGGELTDGQGYCFRNVEDAKLALKMLGEEVEIPAALALRCVTVKRNKDGRVVIAIDWANGDPDWIDGFVADRKRKKQWVRVLNLQADEAVKVPDVRSEEYVRNVISPKNVRLYYTARTDSGAWVRGSLTDAKTLLRAIGHTKDEAEVLCGTSGFRPWTAVSLPFQPEYPGGRQWNIDAAQLRYQPADLDSDEVPHHPHWNMVLSHLGKDLDQTIAKLEWCKKAGIRTGGDYLLYWYACVILEPLEPLPYNFFYGPQNCGKSIAHEGAALLINKGVVSANRTLTNGNEYNGELEGSVIDVIEERNVAKSEYALSRIKDWVTAQTLSIRRMYCDPYEVPNTTHWIQCANDRGHCPVLPGDTRINVIYVSPLEQEIPKKELLAKLEEEAPHFLRTVFDLELPPLYGRLRLPVIESATKRRAVEENRSVLCNFVDKECFDTPGYSIPFSKFKERFFAFIGPDGASEWSDIRLSRALQDDYPTGKMANGKTHVGNLYFTPQSLPKTRLVREGNRLRPMKLDTQPTIPA